MDRWDVLIALAAGYVAVMALVRMMAARRNELVDQVREQIKQQGQKRPARKLNSGTDKDAA